jgi:hypothetical protein
MKSGHQELIVFELRDQGAADRLGIPGRLVAEAELGHAVDDVGLPSRPELQALCRRPLLLGDGLDLALEAQLASSRIIGLTSR